nr:bifunctional riboflavin kinase/FAD synthetase [Acanthopleuribacter pedis]
MAEPVVLMIGNFDGVHRGHQAMIQRARQKACELGAASAILSFQPHPLKVLAPDKAPKLLQTPLQKEALLKHYGLDYYVVKTFDRDFAKLSPRAFVANLCEHIHIRGLIVGFNFHFGFKREGDIHTLARLAPEFGFAFEHIEAQRCEAAPISSSRIRACIADGRIEEASALLGRPYFLQGQVVKGRRLGRTIDAPTANLVVYNELLPRFGVYASWARVRHAWYRAITNVGTNPTVGATGTRVETHLFDFSGDIYGEELVLCLGRFMRDERRFDNMKMLSEQIHKDFRTRLTYLDQEPPVFAIV